MPGVIILSGLMEDRAVISLCPCMNDCIMIMMMITDHFQMLQLQPKWAWDFFHIDRAWSTWLGAVSDHDIDSDISSLSIAWICSGVKSKVVYALQFVFLKFSWWFPWNRFHYIRFSQQNKNYFRGIIQRTPHYVADTALMIEVLNFRVGL